jgi:hypothetical protein
LIASLQRLAARCYELERLLRRADEPRRPDDPKKAAKKIGSPSENSIRRSFEASAWTRCGHVYLRTSGMNRRRPEAGTYS